MRASKKHAAIRFLVTGGSGFIGTNLVQHLLGLNGQIINIDTQEPRNPEHRKYWIKADILDLKLVARLFQQHNPEYLFHLAARTDLRGRSVADYSANVDGVSNVLDAAKKTPSLRHVLFASSMLVCKLGYMPKSAHDYCPTTAYGYSKALGEQLVREQTNLRFQWTIVRPTSLWGPWFGTPYRDFFDYVRRGWYVHPRGVRVLRSYGFVLNSVAQLVSIVMAPRTETHGKTMYVADYDAIELRTWAEEIRVAFGAKPIRNIPFWMLQAIAKLGDAADAVGVNRVPLTTFRLSNLITNAVFDMSEVQSACGPLPWSMKQGVNITVHWLRNGDSVSASA